MTVKRKWLTRITVSILTCAMILSVAGCGDKPTPTTSGEKVTLEVSGWESKYMKHEMAEAYEKTHPNVDIVVHNSSEWEANSYLIKMAAADTMPDIFNVENPEYPVANDWVVNLKPYLDKETDLSIPQNYLDAATYNDEVIMLPSALFAFGVILNKDLLAANNVAIPEYTWTIDEMVNIAKKTTKLGESIGLMSGSEIFQHLPPQMNDDLDWGAFNPTTKHYQLTPEWVTAGEIEKDLFDSKAVAFELVDEVGNPWLLEEGSTERTDIENARLQKQIELIGEDDVWYGWPKGKVAMTAYFSWEIGFDDKKPDGTYANEMYSGYEWDFYPYPVYTAGDVSRPGLVLDSKAISKTCLNPDAAYDYLKFITFSTDGANAKLDILKNYDQAKAKEKHKDNTVFVETDFPATLMDYSIPVTNDKAVLDEWAAYVDAPAGLVYIIGNMDIGYMDGFKVIPGHGPAFGDLIQTQYKEQVLFGTANPADIAADLEAQANAITDEAYAAMVK